MKKTWKPEHTPAHAQVLEVMQSLELEAQQASIYRNAVGILLYLFCDMVQCQWMDFGLMMHYRNDFGSEFLSNAFTDSDWASNKGARKCFCMLLDDGQLLIELWKSEIKVLLQYLQLKLKHMQQPHRTI